MKYITILKYITIYFIQYNSGVFILYKIYVLLKNERMHMLHMHSQEQLKFCRYSNEYKHYRIRPGFDDFPRNLFSLYYLAVVFLNFEIYFQFSINDNNEKIMMDFKYFKSIACSFLYILCISIAKEEENTLFIC